jgi:hypothetical protein
MAALLTTAGCSRRNVVTPTAPVAPGMAKSDDYIDLEPDWKLRIVVPLLKSGGFLPKLTAEPDGSYSAADLIGYEVSYYTVKDKGNTSVRLQFVSAEATRDDKTVPEKHAPTLPFSLPRRAGHIRLVYLVRVSQADHNMAIVASKRPDDLNAFTKRLKENPDICNEKTNVFCSWVPAGVAVRPEKP